MIMNFIRVLSSILGIILGFMVANVIGIWGAVVLYLVILMLVGEFRFKYIMLPFLGIFPLMLVQVVVMFWF